MAFKPLIPVGNSRVNRKELNEELDARSAPKPASEPAPVPQPPTANVRQSGKNYAEPSPQTQPEQPSTGQRVLNTLQEADAVGSVYAGQAPKITGPSKATVAKRKAAEGEVLESPDKQADAVDDLNVETSGLNTQAEAELDRRNAELEAANKQAADERAKEQDDLDKRFAEFEAKQKELDDMAVDPDKYWANKSNSTKVGILALQGIGAIVGAALGEDENAASTAIKAQIDQDIKAQEAAIAGKGKALEGRKNLLGMARERYADKDAARTATKASMLEASAGKLESLAAKTKNAEQRTKLQLEAQKLREEGSKLRYQVASQQEAQERAAGSAAYNAWKKRQDEARGMALKEGTKELESERSVREAQAKEAGTQPQGEDPGTTVPGTTLGGSKWVLRRDPNNPPPKEVAREQAKDTAEYAQAMAGLENYQRLVLAYGKAKVGSPEYQRLQNEIRTTRSVLMGQLRSALIGPGAMDKQEAERLSSTISDPTEASTTAGGANVVISSVKKALAAGFRAKSENRGYLISEPKGQKR